ncbi:hypothetical protein [Candidatus Viridilinea mediisalina]|uniref:YfhO family protein n=1 Tax=Candidatus Viridilinea mediisalina TaxID=2024553 RepID=A0A2A6RKX4_9CHLR|nr:hypothetical protein [Candidatus Viridilinea mediisalina]PDW03727.1 hypothetical protein CJ255_07415 [Candidatus Viridilinea mediisalina]
MERGRRSLGRGARLVMRQRLLKHSLVLGLYTLLTLVVTYPMPLHIGSHVIANGPGQVDAYLGIWNIWWTAQALTSGQSPFFTPLLFHPQGLDLFWQTLSLPQGLLVLPLTLTLGPLPAYNMLILLSFILSGYFTFLLLGYILNDGTEQRPTELAALVGGAVYAFAPFHLQKVLDAQLEVASIQWLPLWAWATYALLVRPRWYLVLLSGAALLWVGLGTWYYGLFTLMTSGVMAGLWALAQTQRGGLEWRLPGGAWRLNLTYLAWGLGPLLLWFVLMAPRLWHMFTYGDTLLGDASEHVQSYADLIAFWLPNPHHPLWGAQVTAFYEGINAGSTLWNVALGLVGTGLGLIGVVKTWRTQWRWLVVGIFAAAIAAGSELIIAGWQTGVPGPYALIRDLPGVRSSHRPNHFVLITILTVALFAALGARLLFMRLKRAHGPWAAAGLIVAVVFIDGWAGPLPLFQRQVPEALRSGDALTGPFFPVPPHLHFSNSEHLWNQIQHGQPILGGFIGRAPPYPLGDYAPGVKALRFGHVDRDDILHPGWPELARESLAAYDLRYVIFHHASMGPPLPLMREYAAEMGLETVYRDHEVTFYAVPSPEVPRPLAFLGAGWEQVEAVEQQHWRWMGEQADLYLVNPSDTPRVVRLTLDLEAFAHARPLRLHLADGATFSLEVSRERMQRTFHLIVPVGETRLRLEAPADALEHQPTRRLSLAVMGIIIE